MNEREQISIRLREQILENYASIKEFARAIGKTQQYVNIYVSGINAPGPKVREILRKAGLDVPYIMTGRQERETGSEHKEIRQIRSVMKEKGITTVEELRKRLDREEVLRRMLGPEAYSTIVQAALLREQRVGYESKKKKSRAK